MRLSIEGSPGKVGESTSLGARQGAEETPEGRRRVRARTDGAGLHSGSEERGSGSEGSAHGGQSSSTSSRVSGSRCGGLRSGFLRSGSVASGGKSKEKRARKRSCGLDKCGLKRDLSMRSGNDTDEIRLCTACHREWDEGSPGHTWAPPFSQQRKNGLRTIVRIRALFPQP